ncbi:MAG: 50S ribosomal protein L18 [Candidatus Vogelbacteria bacterium]|nr:50S ribosomal protein L18 [Candidatus Vogelbacteria bacterium]
MPKVTNLMLRNRRRARVRSKVMGTSERPRLAVFRSNKYVYAQLIDDIKGVTLVSAGGHAVGGVSLKTKKTKVKVDSPFTKVLSAQVVGETIGALARDRKITKVVFDRGGYRYTGRVKAVADGARQAGLIF